MKIVARSNNDHGWDQDSRELEKAPIASRFGKVRICKFQDGKKMTYLKTKRLIFDNDKHEDVKVGKDRQCPK